MKLQPHIAVIAIVLSTMSACVSYLPPSSIHYDMIQNDHPILSDSLVEHRQMVSGNISGHLSSFHHRRDPEVEDNRSWSLKSSYAYAEQKQSAAVSLAYSAGHIYTDEGFRYRHSNLIFRASYAYDFHQDRWNGHLVKIQGAASRGYGRYQNLLRDNYKYRDEYNLAISNSKWLYSFGYGSQFFYDLKTHHQVGLGLYFNYSTDFDNNGFHTEFFNLELDYRYKEKYTLDLGAMLDARFTPRGETFYLGLGYQHNF